VVVKAYEEEPIDTPAAKRETGPELMPDIEPTGPLGPRPGRRALPFHQ
jgi:hypothetical protein